MRSLPPGNATHGRHVCYTRKTRLFVLELETASGEMDRYTTLGNSHFALYFKCLEHLDMHHTRVIIIMLVSYFCHRNFMSSDNTDLNS